MISFGDQGQFQTSEATAAQAIQRLQACGYAITGVRTFTKRRFGRPARITEFTVMTRIGERVRAGQARAKANGTRLGRPPVEVERVKQIDALLDQALSLRAIAAAVHVGRGTVARIRAARGSAK